MLAKDQTTVLKDFATARDWTLFEPRADIQEDQLFFASLLSITDHVRSMEPHRSEHAQQGFEVSLGFLESALPNALANKQNTVHIAAVHSGLASCMHEFSLFCLAQASVFPMIGRIDLETSPNAIEATPPGVALLLALLKPQQDKPPLDRLTMPHCPERFIATHYLTLMMMRFVWLHEIAHGLLGHVDYLRSLKSTRDVGFSELELNELTELSPSIDGRVLQVMEFEADSWALSKLLSLHHEGSENIEGIAAMDKDTRLRMSLFAAYAITWLMEVMANTFTRGKLNITHPAPVRRMQMLQTIAAQELNHLGLDVATITQDALVQFECVFSQIGKQWVQTDKFNPVGHQAVFDEM